MSSFDLSQIQFKEEGALVPAIIQDAKTQAVLMLGYMNAEALNQTAETGKVTFWSRSRKSIWVKGETSGDTFYVEKIQPDCDRDAILIQVHPEGSACHRGTTTCFDASPIEFLDVLESVITQRMTQSHEGSYVARLISEGLDRVAQKVGEEAIETVIASKNAGVDELESESADLLFHLMVLLKARGSSLTNVVKLLSVRHSKK